MRRNVEANKFYVFDRIRGVKNHTGPRGRDPTKLRMRIATCLRTRPATSVAHVSVDPPKCEPRVPCAASPRAQVVRRRTKLQGQSSEPTQMADHAIEKKAPAPFSNAAGTDGGWVASKPLKTRYTSSTGITSFDGESAWDQYDPHILVPKEWGKQSENFQKSLRGWPEPDFAHTNTATWKHANTKRWPLLRQPKYNRSGVECSL